MSYYNRYKNRRKDNSAQPHNQPPTGMGAPDAVFDLGKNKRVTVRQFRTVNLIDIREYYVDSSTGELKPGKKGISMTEELYDELLKHRLNIDEALRRLGSKRARTKISVVESDDDDDLPTATTTTTTTATATANDTKQAAKDGSAKPARQGDRASQKENESKRKRAPAEPSMLPTEEKKHLQMREANAVLVVPSMVKKVEELVNPQLPVQADAAPTTAAPTTAAPTTTGPLESAQAGNASDEEFANHLDQHLDTPGSPEPASKRPRRDEVESEEE